MTIEKSKIKFGLKELQNLRGAMTFARLLTSYRTAVDLTQVELAKKLKLSKANLCDLEKGRKIPSPARAEEIAKALKELPQYWVEVAVQDMLTSQKLKYVVKLVGDKVA
jgi:transcriptional regulator with XRE-family HTH domain